MKSICLFSPAKLNLTLKVINKRLDGYHNLSTLFEKVDLCDEVRLTRTQSKRIRVFCAHPAVPIGPRNLAYKAAKLLQQDFALSCGADIHIKKRIPVAAGLAGGSSNGATTLLGLNKIWKLGLKEGELVFYAKKLGADVPLFIYTYKYAIGKGRGDELKKADLSKKMWHIVVIPRIKVYSREVFRAFKLKLTKRYDNVNILTRTLKKGSVAKVSALLSNDLEASIVHAHPKLLQIKKNIEKMIGTKVIFSGSGPSLFGLVESEHKAKQLKSILSKHYAQVFALRTL
ncbi:MAG: 4-(cytidine 5'-diphospho)-2-C-methyl-D-erythritol kinase [Candidatus Aceula meridiana]|nr:4-(cytidine 5'-diphospho)-2-C-methyl-D-erythritol kinase [Candidatus Aceula meridiana]